jgi:hypothetical protein
VSPTSDCTLMPPPRRNGLAFPVPNSGFQIFNFELLILYSDSYPATLLLFVRYLLESRVGALAPTSLVDSESVYNADPSGLKPIGVKLISYLLVDLDLDVDLDVDYFAYAINFFSQQSGCSQKHADCANNSIAVHVYVQV